MAVEVTLGIAKARHDLEPILGTRKRTRLEQNVAAASLALDAAALDALEPLAREVAGIVV